MRSRTSSLPRAVWRSRERSGPPRAVRATSSATSCSSRAWPAALRSAAVGADSESGAVVLAVMGPPSVNDD